MSILKSTKRIFKFQLTERVEALRESLRLKKKEFCKKIGFSASNYNNITGTKRESKPTIELIEGIANNITNVNVDWLLTGNGEMFSTSPSVGESSDASSQRLNIVYYQDLFAVAGTDEDAIDEPLAEYEVSKEFLTHLTDGFSTNKLMAISVKGNSMEPTLMAGDIVLVDQLDSSLQDGCIYILTWQGGVYVKRIQLFPNKLRLLSDNPEFETITIESNQTEKPEIIGRVSVRLGRV